MALRRSAPPVEDVDLTGGGSLPLRRALPARGSEDEVVEAVLVEVVGGDDRLAGEVARLPQELRFLGEIDVSGDRPVDHVRRTGRLSVRVVRKRPDHRVLEAIPVQIARVDGDEAEAGLAARAGGGELDVRVGQAHGLLGDVSRDRNAAGCDRKPSEGDRCTRKESHRSVPRMGGQVSRRAMARSLEPRTGTGRRPSALAPPLRRTSRPGPWPRPQPHTARRRALVRLVCGHRALLSSLAIPDRAPSAED